MEKNISRYLYSIAASLYILNNFIKIYKNFNVDKKKTLRNFNIFAAIIHIISTSGQIIGSRKNAKWKFNVTYKRFTPLSLVFKDIFNLKNNQGLNNSKYLKSISLEIENDTPYILITKRNNDFNTIQIGNVKNKIFNKFNSEFNTGVIKNNKDDKNFLKINIDSKYTNNKSELVKIFYNKLKIIVKSEEITEKFVLDNIFVGREIFNKFLIEDKKLFNIPLGASVASFSAVCALAHIILLYLGEYLPKYHPMNYYKWILEDNINYLRWFEYFISSGIMVVNIAALTRTTDIFYFANIFILTATTNLFGLWTEKVGIKNKKTNWREPFFYGFIPFILPWIQIIEQYLSSTRYYENEIKDSFVNEEDANRNNSLPDNIPTFIRILTFTLFGIYFLFPLNMYKCLNH